MSRVHVTEETIFSVNTYLSLQITVWNWVVFSLMNLKYVVANVSKLSKMLFLKIVHNNKAQKSINKRMDISKIMEYFLHFESCNGPGHSTESAGVSLAEYSNRLMYVNHLMV